MFDQLATQGHEGVILNPDTRRRVNAKRERITRLTSDTCKELGALSRRLEEKLRKRAENEKPVPVVRAEGRAANHPVSMTCRSKCYDMNEYAMTVPSAIAPADRAQIRTKDHLKVLIWNGFVRMSIFTLLPTAYHPVLGIRRARCSHSCAHPIPEPLHS